MKTVMMIAAMVATAFAAGVLVSCGSNNAQAPNSVPPVAPLGSYISGK